MVIFWAGKKGIGIGIIVIEQGEIGMLDDLWKFAGNRDGAWFRLEGIHWKFIGFHQQTIWDFEYHPWDDKTIEARDGWENYRTWEFTTNVIWCGCAGCVWKCGLFTLEISHSYGCLNREWRRLPMYLGIFRATMDRYLIFRQSRTVNDGCMDNRTEKRQIMTQTGWLRIIPHCGNHLNTMIQYNTYTGYYWLVVSTPLKNIEVIWDDELPTIDGKIKNVPNQPVYIVVAVPIVFNLSHSLVRGQPCIWWNSFETHLGPSKVT